MVSTDPFRIVLAVTSYSFEQTANLSAAMRMVKPYSETFCSPRRNSMKNQCHDHSEKSQQRERFVE
jgi:hypothetical protein